MNCRHCGGVNPPGAKVCEFCGSELQEKEKVYIPVHEYPSPPPAAGFQRSRQQIEGGKATALAILSLIFGFVILRSILAFIALKICNNLIKEARQEGVAVPSNVKTARTICFVSLAIAAMCAVYLLTAALSGAFMDRGIISSFYS